MMVPSNAGPKPGPSISRCYWIDNTTQIECKAEVTGLNPLCDEHLTLALGRSPVSSPPVKKQAPFQTTDARLLPDPLRPSKGPKEVMVMRKTASGPRRPSSASPASPNPIRSSAGQRIHTKTQPDGHDGPERKRRRLDSRTRGSPELSDEGAIRGRDEHRLRKDVLSNGISNGAGSIDLRFRASAVNGSGYSKPPNGHQDLAVPHHDNERPFAVDLAKNNSTTGSRPPPQKEKPSETLSSQAFYGAKSAVNGVAGTVEHGSTERDDDSASTARPSPAPNSTAKYNPGIFEWYSRVGLTQTTRTKPRQSVSSDGTPGLSLSMPMSGERAGDDREYLRSGWKNKGKEPQKQRRLPSIPLEEKSRRQFSAQSAFDTLIYGQDSAKLAPPRGVSLNIKEREPPPKPPDEPFCDYINPHVHWILPRSEAWLEAKQHEIKARGGRKANFGQAIRSQAERRKEKQSAAAKKRGQQPPAATSASEGALSGGGGAGDQSSAVARFRKQLDAWGQQAWEKDKKALQKEVALEKLKKGRQGTTRR